jgi:hypothetical protein
VRRVIAAKALAVLLTALIAGALWSRPAPAQATGVTAIGAGTTFMCSVSTSANVRCWGDTNWAATTPAIQPVIMYDESGGTYKVPQ